MKLSIADVARLFGARLYRLPGRAGAEGAGAAAPPQAVAAGAPVGASALGQSPSAAPDPRGGTPSPAADPTWTGPAQARLGVLLTPEQLAMQAELLDKILQAVGFTRDQVRILGTSQAPAALSGAPSTVLAFGLLVPGTVELPSLDAMAADVNLKRQAWERLKPLKAQLAS